MFPINKIIIFLSTMATQQEYALIKADNGFVAVSRLDHVIPGLNSTLTDADVAFMQPIGDAVELTHENEDAFYLEMRKRATERIYTTVDHLPIRVVCASGLTVLYVSLDNSFRANQNNHALTRRFDAILEMLRSLFKGRDDVLLFFSEACRYSVDIVDGKDENRHEWMHFQRRLVADLNLCFLGEKPNNEDASGKSFGLAAFAKPKTYAKVDKVLPKQLITDGLGSVALGVNVAGDIFWAVHFPLDFKNSGADNAKTMASLCKAMDEHPGTMCAIGDFNTIPGKIEEVMRAEMARAGKKFLREDGVPTFFGAYFDMVTRPTADVVLI